MKKALKIIFWIVAFILFPIAAGLYFVWPSKLFKDRMPKGWRIFCWVVYVPLSISLVFVKVCCFLFVIECGFGFNGKPYTTRDNVPISDYRTSEDFHKLTGVEFPELEMVDSLFHDENIIRANHWGEYKFVAKEGLNDSFYKRLDQACKEDSGHWRYDKERRFYRYLIYPDQQPVDRSRGMCDRMIKMNDGSLMKDFQGNFISVKIQGDTIVLQKGWLR